MNDKNSVDEVVAAFKAHLEGMADFEQAQFHVKKHSGTFGHMDVVKITPFLFSDNEPNVTASNNILQLFKYGTLQAQATNRDTSISFSVTIDKNGRAKSMNVQDFKKL